MHVWDVLPASFRESLQPSTYVYPRYLRLAMGHSHSVHILMSINATAVGRAFHAARRLLSLDAAEEEPTAVAPALSSVVLGADFCKSSRDVAPDDDSTCAPSASEESCGDVLDDGWESDLQDESWREIHLSRQPEVSHESSSTGKSLDEWLETLRGLRLGPERVFVVVHLFSGERREGDLEEWVIRLAQEAKLKVHVTSADLAEHPEWDLSSPVVCDKLMQAIEEGLVDIVVCGPPCSTWSAARWINNGMGVRPVRVRGEFAWGLPNLRRGERERVKMANDCATNALIFCEGVSSRGGGHLWEHPRDRGHYPYASIWATPEMTEMERRVNAKRFLVDQCRWGCPCKKPTTLSGTLEGLDTGPLLCTGDHPHGMSIGKKADGSFRTRGLQTYSSEMNRWIAERIIQTLLKFQREGSGPTGWRRGAVMTKRISAWSTRPSQARGPGIAFMNEHGPRSSMVSLTPQQFAFYLHVDDGVVFGDGGRNHDVNWLVNEASNQLESIGFDVKDRQFDPELEKIVGYSVRRNPARLELPLKRAGLLREALRWMVAQMKVDTSLLRSLIGIWIWGALLRRDLLSVPHAVFRFMNFHDGNLATWWQSARREVSAMAELIPSMYMHLGAPVAPVLFATDARGGDGYGDAGGFGGVAVDVGSDVVRSYLERCMRPGFTVTKLDGSFSGRLRPEEPWRRTVPFSRITNEIVSLEDWKPVFHGRWAYQDHITLGEARSVVKLTRTIGSVRSCHGHKVASLQDNMATSGAFSKGRSCAPSLNYLARQKGATAVAADLVVLLPWVQTSIQPADEISRL